MAFCFPGSSQCKMNRATFSEESQTAPQETFGLVSVQSRNNDQKDLCDVCSTDTDRPSTAEATDSQVEGVPKNMTRGCNFNKVVMEVYPHCHSSLIIQRQEMRILQAQAQAKQPRPFPIRVEAFKRQCFDMEVMFNEQVQDFRDRLIDILGMPEVVASSLGISHEGVFLENPYRTIWSYGIRRDSKILCVWRFYHHPSLKESLDVLPCRIFEDVISGRKKYIPYHKRQSKIVPFTSFRNISRSVPQLKAGLRYFPPK